MLGVRIGLVAVVVAFLGGLDARAAAEHPARARSTALEARGDYRAAALALAPLEAEQPQDYALALHAAWLWFQAGDHARALPRYERAIALSEGAPDAHAGRAWTLYRLGRHDAARAAFRALARVAPEHPAPAAGLALLDPPALVGGAVAVGGIGHVYPDDWAVGGYAAGSVHYDGLVAGGAWRTTRYVGIDRDLTGVAMTLGAGGGSGGSGSGSGEGGGSRQGQGGTGDGSSGQGGDGGGASTGTGAGTGGASGTSSPTTPTLPIDGTVDYLAHQGHVWLGWSRPAWGVRLHYARTLDERPADLEADVLGVSGRLSLLGDLRLEVSWSDYVLDDVLRVRTSWCLYWDLLWFRPELAVQRVGSETLYAGALTVGLAVGPVVAWLGAGLGEQDRPVDLALALVHSAYDHPVGGVWVGLDLAAGGGWHVVATYDFTGYTRGGLSDVFGPDADPDHGHILSFGLRLDL